MKLPDINYIINLLVYNPDEPAVFISGFFLWFFVIFILFYSAFSKTRILRLIVIVVFSYYFYYKTSGNFIALLFISSVLEYYLSLGIHNSGKKWLRRIMFTFILLINISVLVYFKYSNFFIGIFNDVSGNNFSLSVLAVPVGISFFTFQKLGYSIDIFRKNGVPAKNIAEFFSFVSFFPVIQSGPILRANRFIPQLQKNDVLVSNEDIGKAVFLIIAGLFKKIVISDYIGLNFVDRVFENPMLYSGFENLAAVYGYTLQIYCDFSGYTDIAIGLGLLIGLKIPANFNSPYKSLSIKEFWQRWHISLSFWLRDYLFLPVAYKITRILKNRKFLKLKSETWSYHISILLTMLVCGIWHGANWTFIVWGILHGAGISVERIIKSPFRFKSNFFSKGAGGFITFNFIAFAWILFRADDFSTVSGIVNQIFGSFNVYAIPDILAGYKEVFIIIVFGYILHFIPEKTVTLTENIIVRSPLILKALYIVIAVWLIIQIKSADVQPFIYFNF